MPHRLRAFFAERDTLARVVNLTGLLAAACLAFALALRRAEGMGWGEASWQVWQTVTTVGYGNQPAATGMGRAATMLFGLLGIALLGALISAWFDWRADTRERRRIGEMDNPFSNGYLIINFPGAAKFAALATELAANDERADICVVDSQLPELPIEVQHLPRVRVHYVRGSLLSESTYARAAVARSKSILIFPQQTGVPESDAATKMVVEIVTKLAPQSARIAHVLVSPENEWLFAGSRSTTILELDEILILVQECRDPMAAVVLQDLLRPSTGCCPLTVTPERTVGWTWGRFARACVAAADSGTEPVQPLALVKGNVPTPCPAPQTRIEAGDRLTLVVRSADFDWSRFEASLLQFDAGERVPAPKA